MQSRSIFAGIDSDGVRRFVGDMPQGAACRCFCAACGSPLVAKKGDVYAWHFAHEANQERPDCYAGAVNLLRTLVIEQLYERLQRPLPTYRSEVRLSPPHPAHHEPFEWEPGTATSVLWPTLMTQSAPVVLLTLASGTQVFVFVTIDGEGDPRTVDPRNATLLLDVPLPLEAAQLKDLAQAKRYIDEAGHWQWLALPDVDAMKAAKLQAMKEVVHARQRAAAEQMRTQREAGAQRLHALRQQFQARQHAAQQPAQTEPAEPPEAEPLLPESPWAAWRKQPSSIIYYQLKDGSRWLMLAHQDGRHVLAPWPPAEEGWDEALPPRLGLVDLTLGGLVLNDQTETMIYLSSKLQTSRNSSNWHELVEAVRGLTARKFPD